MKKRALLIFFTYLALFIAIPIKIIAQDGNPQLVVWKKDMSKVYYYLSDQPVTTFVNGNLVINTTNTTMEYPLKDILRYTYEGVNTGIESLENENSVFVKQEQDKLSLTNLKKGTEVYLYNINGRLLDIKRSNGTDAVVISISSHPQGVYIVKTGTETIKLLKR